MAISPPSDILLDVANAADPGQVRAATARLAKLASDPAAIDDSFGKALSAANKQGSAPTTRPALSTLAQATTARAAAMPSTDGAKGTYQKFEALLLQNFVESMLPKDDELYGDKTSAGVYRSMLAEQFANQMSKAGGIGIAKAIAARHPGMTAHAPTPAPDVTAAAGIKLKIV